MMNGQVSSEEKEKIKNYVSKLQLLSGNNDEINKSFISQVLDELCILNGHCVSIPVSSFIFPFIWYFICIIFQNHCSLGQIHLYSFVLQCC